MRVECPACGANTDVAPENLGKKGRCKCGHVFVLASNAIVFIPAETGSASPTSNASQDDKSTSQGDNRRVPDDYPNRFVWWQQRNSGKTYPFRCPTCRTTVELRQRVTQKARVCPGCGFQITIAAIDLQLDYDEPSRQRIIASSSGGCMILFAMLAGGGATVVMVAIGCLQ
ncbi:MAG: hypothetical protein JWN70_5556 [Planctomycetaceae bacterium]|nr:hypothetical protein [Planctomycetaceae bacterium]